MKCVQCGVISAVEESLGTHLKAAYFETEMRDIRGEVSIFVAFLKIKYRKDQTCAIFLQT